MRGPGASGAGVQAVTVAARLVVGGVWVLAGALKLPDPAESVRAVRAYQLLPESVVPLVGHGLPVLEVVVGVALVVGVLSRPVAVLSALMLLAFVGGIASAWARGLSIECGCFGGGGATPDAASAYPWEIARDVGLLAASLWVAAWPRTRWSVDHHLLHWLAGDPELEPATVTRQPSASSPKGS